MRKGYSWSLAHGGWTLANRKTRPFIDRSAAIRANALLMEQILDSIYQYIALLDPDGTIRFLNRAAVAATNVAECDLLGVFFWQGYWWQGTDIARLRAALSDAARGTFVRYETEIVTIDGPLIIDFSLNPLTDEAGNVVQLVAEGRNITARKRAEEALKRSERQLRQIIDLVPHFIFAKDTEGRFLLANRAVADAYGTTVDRLLHMTDADFAKSEREVIAFRDADQAVIASGRPVVIPEERITDAAGQVRVLATTKIPFTELENNVPAVLGVSVDITEKMQLWESAQRVQRLESVGVLAGGIAHDFNNLLAGLFGHLDLARTTSRDPEVTSSIDAAMTALGRARGLTQQLLTFARGGAPNRRMGSLHHLIQSTARFTLAGSNISCHMDIPDDLWLCEHDPDQIGQVFNNVILNAQQAMPLGGTLDILAANETLLCQQHPHLPAGRYVRVTFQDQGIGIPADILPRVFDPYFTTKQKGNGLGLAIAYSIVDRHGGAIDVTSEVGRGTTMTVRLPASPGEALCFGPELPRQHCGGGRVLVMDDELVILDLLRMMLDRMGYETVQARNGDEAIAAFHEARRSGRPFAAILLDLTIRGGQGGQATVIEIRQHDPTIPVFVLSGYADDPVVADPAAHGFTDSLSKPFTMDALAKLLNRSLPGHKEDL